MNAQQQNALQIQKFRLISAPEQKSICNMVVLSEVFTYATRQKADKRTASKTSKFYRTDNCFMFHTRERNQ